MILLLSKNFICTAQVKVVLILKWIHDPFVQTFCIEKDSYMDAI